MGTGTTAPEGVVLCVHTTEAVSVYPLERATRVKAELLAAGCHADVLLHLGADKPRGLFVESTSCGDGAHRSRASLMPIVRMSPPMASMPNA